MDERDYFAEAPRDTRGNAEIGICWCGGSLSFTGARADGSHRYECKRCERGYVVTPVMGSARPRRAAPPCPRCTP